MLIKNEVSWSRGSRLSGVIDPDQDRHTDRQTDRLDRTHYHTAFRVVIRTWLVPTQRTLQFMRNLIMRLVPVTAAHREQICRLWPSLCIPNVGPDRSGVQTTITSQACIVLKINDQPPDDTFSRECFPGLVEYLVYLWVCADHEKERGSYIQVLPGVQRRICHRFRRYFESKDCDIDL